MYVKGVNLGNWLVLEKWMSPALFEGTTAEDEYYLPTQLPPEVYEARIKVHRSEYISERDFAVIKRVGMNMVRIPVPYFIFGRSSDASKSWIKLLTGRRNTGCRFSSTSILPP